MKEAVGRVNRPVAIAGTVVCPGDAVIADDDGVVCVPRGSAEEVLAACRRRTDREAVSRAAYAEGELSLDVNDLRGLVHDLGVEYVSWDDNDEGEADDR